MKSIQHQHDLDIYIPGGYCVDCGHVGTGPTGPTGSDRYGPVCLHPQRIDTKDWVTGRITGKPAEPCQKFNGLGQCKLYDPANVGKIEILPPDPLVATRKANAAGWTVAVCMLLAFVVYVIAVSR